MPPCSSACNDKLGATETMITQASKHTGRRSQTREQLVRTFDLYVRKTRRNIQTLADSPKSGAWAADGNYIAFKEGFYEIGNWTSSFFTGMALLALGFKEPAQLVLAIPAGLFASNRGGGTWDIFQNGVLAGLCSCEKAEQYSMPCRINDELRCPILAPPFLLAFEFAQRG